MAFELWSSVSSNLLATFETRAEALACVREVAAKQGHEYASAYVLLYEDRRRHSRQVAAGEALVQQALDAAAPPAATSERSA